LSAARQMQKYDPVMWHFPKREVCDAAPIKQKEKNQKCRVLVPDELYNSLSHAELERLLLPHGFWVKDKTTPLYKL
jgi:hypothetical protein